MERGRAGRGRWAGGAVSLAAAVGLACAWPGGDPGLDRALGALTVELVAPSRQVACPLPPEADPTDVGDVMELGFSPATSKLSFLVHHAEETAPDARRDGVIQATAELLGCVALAGTAEPKAHAELRQRYVEQMTALREAVALLQLSAIEYDGAASAHAFEHVRTACAACHLVYKPGE